MRVALDSNAYSEWRRSGRWTEEISTAVEVHVSATALGELRYGFACGSRESENLAALRDFLSEPMVVTDRAGDETAEIYAALKKHLRSQGTPIPENDIWIAASAVEHGLELLTDDRHFEKLPQVRVRWLEG